MPKSRPFSFRRILLLRILLLSTPILLLGQYATIRKARTSLLETARQNLAISAIEKGDYLNRTIRSLEGSIQAIAQTSAVESASPGEFEAILVQFAAKLPHDINCIQLNDIQTGQVVLNTCDTPLVTETTDLPWVQPTAPAVRSQASDNFYLVSAMAAEPQRIPPQDVPPQANPTSTQGGEDLMELPPNKYSFLDVVIATPVYSNRNNLRYTLSVRATISILENSSLRSLTGDTVIIDANDIILLHPDPNLVGKSIYQINGNDARLRSLISNAKAGNSSTLHLANFLPAVKESLAGYAGIEIPMTDKTSQAWTVISVTPLEHALQGLRDIRQALIVLTAGLLAANAVLALYLARSLSHPIERLSHYAQQIQELTHLREIPRDFKIWELDHLALVLNRMMKRLEERARELKHAWNDAQLANQLKSEFLANTSHELRTPLNAIIGCIRLIRDDCCDSREEEMEFLDRADHAAIHLLKIINDILDVAKIESGTLSLKIEPVDVGQVIAEVVDLQIVQVQQKGLKLIYPELGSPIVVSADRSKLKQVLLNVVYNATKFTDAGSITIRVSDPPRLTAPEVGSDLNPEAVTSTGTKPTKPLSPVVITVQDTGIGIEPSQQSKLFRPFVMVDGSTTRRFEGTGLGLAISRNLMELMEGDIHLSSEGLGQGTTVTLTLKGLDASTLDQSQVPDKDSSVNDEIAATESEGLMVSSEL